MVSAEASLSPTPQSFRQRFAHLIPGADNLVPSALPKLKEVLLEFRKRHVQGRANLDHRAFFFVQNDARGVVSRASHSTLHVNSQRTPNTNHGRR
jgi:hypothetical protein